MRGWRGGNGVCASPLGVGFTGLKIPLAMSITIFYFGYMYLPCPCLQTATVDIYLNLLAVPAQCPQPDHEP